MGLGGCRQAVSAGRARGPAQQPAHGVRLLITLDFPAGLLAN